MSEDEKVRNSLQFLADKHDLEFENVSYADAFQKRLVEFETPKLSQQLGQIKYEFEVPKEFNQTNISVSWSGTSIINLFFGLKHEDGRLINFHIAEVPSSGDVYAVNINTIPQDGTGMFIPSVQYPLLDDAKKSAGNSKVSYQDEWLMINIYPDDPLLFPVNGKWTVYVAAPAGLDVVIGASTI